jgi:DNA-binding CsgD family transcriptional regulator
MNRAKKFEPDAALSGGFLVHPKTFVFFDKKTGIRRFEVEAGQDGSMPMEQAVNLLAIQCVARQLTPSDFGILIGIGKDLVDSLVGRAARLMRSCSIGRLPVPLSRRQREVLNCIVRSQTNKEIALMLNISVRTIKFHVSVLLAKFNVHSRVDLLEATNVLSPDAIHNVEPRLQHRSTPENGVAEAFLRPPGRPNLLIPVDSRAAR